MATAPKAQKVTITYPRGQKYFLIPNYTVQNFYGLNTVIQDVQKVPDGFASDSLNWVTGNDNECIMLRRGYHLLGQTRAAGAGAILGLGIGDKADGSQIPFFATSDGRMKYYDATTQDTAEIGSQIIPLAARQDTISIFGYQNLAGYFTYLSSPNWDIVKIHNANPGNYLLQLSNNYKGYMLFGQSRALLFNNKDVNGRKDTTGLYMSNIDRPILNDTLTTYAYTGTTTKGSSTVASLSSTTSLAVGMEIHGTGIPPSTTILSINAGSSTLVMSSNATAGASSVALTFGTLLFPFVQTTGEAVGNSGQQSYSYALLQVSGVMTCFGLNIQAAVAAGTEVFEDDQNGNLTSNFGGTGTVNYATGAITLNFSAVTTGNVTASYYTEDATSGGIADFANTTTTETDATTGAVTPVPHVPSSGRYYAQFDGGNLNAIAPLASVFYSFHDHKCWQTIVPTDDDDQGTTPSSNLPFRDKMGVASPDSAEATSLGIFYINNDNPAWPEVYQLKPYTGATAANIAAPKLVSAALNLSGYNFDVAALFQWNIYILVACAQIRNGTIDAFNSRTFLYNTRNGSWDLLDYPTSHFADWSGTLLSGDPLTNNVFQLFSGFDDDGGITPNHWTSGATSFGILGQKSVLRMAVNGLIQPSQNLKVSVAYDGGNFIEIFRILGTGAYVDNSVSIDVGENTLGSKTIGGGATVFANPFEVEFPLCSPRFEYVQVRFEACVAANDTDPALPQGGGYVEVDWYDFRRGAFKGQRSPNSRQVL